MSATDATNSSRGRVIALLGNDRMLVRTSLGDVEATRGPARPGDLVVLGRGHDGSGPVTVVRAFTGGDYPEPRSEVARLGPARRRGLAARATLMARLRQFFAERGFLEVETPLLVPAPGLEVHLCAMPAAGSKWLITSPEFQMKRLLAAGLEQIYTVCKCFRADEEGHHHSSEFTMLEWYRAWNDLDAIARDTEDLVAACADALCGSTRITALGRDIELRPPWRRMSVAEAMAELAGVEVRGDEEPLALAEAMSAAGIDVGGARAWDDIFFAAFVSRVEPAMAELGEPILLMDWPAPLAALARPKPGNPRVVERFEAYIAGIELCNAFGELTCPAEQRARFAADLSTRAERGLPVYPIDDRFLAALEEGLPPCAGIALGIDRLVMLLAGATHIRDVLTFTTDEL